MRNMQNLTFRYLGFEGVKNIAVMRFNVAKSRYETMDFPRGKSVHDDLLVPLMGKYLTKNYPKGFVAALAYMLDGSIEYAQHGEEGTYLVKGGKFEKDYYKICNAIDSSSNVECIGSLIMAHQPEGLMLLQEIPSEDRKQRRFRVVHESPWDDRIDEKERKALLEIKKRAILNSCAEYLRELDGPEQLSEEEIRQVVAIFGVIETLDPQGKSVKLGKGKDGRKKDGRKKDGKKKGGDNVVPFQDNRQR